jgi:hypothetical protein
MRASSRTRGAEHDAEGIEGPAERRPISSAKGVTHHVIEAVSPKVRIELR